MWAVTTENENELLKKRLEFALSHGFGFNINTMKTVMSEIAANGLPGLKTSTRLPSCDAIHTWRARSMDIAYRKAKSKSPTKVLN